MRHAPFAVTPEQKDRWLKHMRDAVDSLDLSEEQHTILWEYLERAAQFMVNTFDADGPPAMPGLTIQPRP
jgi:hemoglobin